MASFSGLIIGKSAIHAAQRSLDITGQNIANSATPGYTRQRVDLQSVGGPGVPAFWSKYNGTGEGVRVTGVSRLYDEFLEARARNSNAALGALEEEQKSLAAVERTVNEPTDQGLRQAVNDMWKAWSKITTAPKDSAPRNAAYQSMVTVVDQLNRSASSVATQWEDTRAELDANITDINSMATDVATLNKAIRNNTIAQVPSNELLDQRDYLIAKLAKLTGATVAPMAVTPPNEAFGAVDVYIGGEKIVEGINAYSVVASGPANNVAGATDTVGITWASGPNIGGVVTLDSGSVNGQLKALNTILPKFAQSFDQVAQQLADTINAQQLLGYTINAPAAAAVPNGQALLTAADGVTTVGISAATIRMAASSNESSLAISTGNPNAPVGAIANGDNALAMAAHASDTTGAISTYNDMIVGLGVQAQSVNRNVDVQRNVVKQAEDARDNVSGVSLNEEMANMVQFQHSFDAAAKFISAIDSMLDTLINMVR